MKTLDKKTLGWMAGLLFCGGLAAPLLLGAHDGEKHADGDRAKIESAVRAVAKAWGNADGPVFRRHYASDPEMRFVESGGENVGIEDLVENHVIPEQDHFKKMRVIVNGVEIHVSKDNKSAWSLSTIEFKATTKKGKKIHSKGFETMIWEKRDRRWRILHSHSSMRRAE